MAAIVARVRLDHLRHNLAAIGAYVPRGTRICFVVKADAYGHGAVRAARAAAAFGIDTVAVSSVDEGRELREAGIRGSVLLLGPTVPDQAADVARWRLTAVCADVATARAIRRRQPRRPAARGASGAGYRHASLRLPAGRRRGHRVLDR